MVFMSGGAMANEKYRCGFNSRPVQPFAFPGLWDCWIDQKNGKKLYSFTIITTRANALLSRIHDRMPVIYDRGMGRSWLEEPVSDPLVLSLILQPVPSERLEAYEVSTLVNSPDNDSPECVRQLRKAQKQVGE